MKNEGIYKVYEGNRYTKNSYPIAIVAVIKNGKSIYCESYVLSELFEGKNFKYRAEIQLDKLPEGMELWTDTNYLLEECLHLAKTKFIAEVQREYEGQDDTKIFFSSIEFREENINILHRLRIRDILSNELKGIKNYTYSEELKGYLKRLLAIMHVELPWTE